MKYSPTFFRDGLPEWKRKKDPLLAKLFYRPVSFYLSAFFCEIGWTANCVSYFSALLAVVACICFVFSAPMAGALLVNGWLLLDCADGNIARCVRKERYGDFADSMSSYIAVGFLFSCIGYHIYQSGGFLVAAGTPWIIFLGSLASSCDSLMRLLYQKYLNSMYAQGLDVHKSEDPEQESVINRLRMKVDARMSIGGFLPLALIVAASVKALDIIIFIWFVYYGMTFLATCLYLIHKTVQANNDDINL